MTMNNFPLSRYIVATVLGLGFVVGQPVSLLAETDTKKASSMTVSAIDPVATDFGLMDKVWGMRLSPNGQNVVFLHQALPMDLPIMSVLELSSGKVTGNMASVPDVADINWCQWANDDRLLCGFAGVVRHAHILWVATRLVAVNANGSKSRVLMQRRLQNQFTQFQDRIVDWLPDDPKSVLLQVQDGNSHGVSKINIYSGSTERILRDRENVREYLSDGRGEPRLYYYTKDGDDAWFYRLAGDTKWQNLHRSNWSDESSYRPLGFADDPNVLYTYDSHNGRRALFKQNLAGDNKPDLVYAHPDVDISGLLTVGKYDRVVGVRYVTDRGHTEFFDPTVAAVAQKVSAAFPYDDVVIIDESHDRRYYLLHLSSAVTPGTYYRYDNQKNELTKIADQYPQLDNRDLGQVRIVRFRARDKVEVSGYLTLPPKQEEQKNLPLVVMPHGGPHSRDTWDFDWLSQYIAAKGYAVLKVNYRGSSGFGEDWSGDGGFRAWQQALNDITDGVKATIASGRADAKRVCVVGASYGGFAALMSAIEEPDLYRCIVSIAGVSDLEDLKMDRRYFLHWRETREFIGRDTETLRRGSPIRRAGEIKVPVQLFHGEDDINVRVDHSRDMAKALKSAGKQHELVIYDKVDHYYRKTGARTDMLDKIGKFLAAHNGPQATAPVLNSAGD